jgi:HPt (histidine-containing phosphotransfer) domain-containing protein
VVDLAVIANLRDLDDGGDGFLLEVLDGFRGESPGRFAALRSAAAAGNAAELVRVVHALKGAARTLGLARFAVLCQDVETSAKAGTLPAAATLHRMDAEYAAALRALVELGVGAR